MKQPDYKKLYIGCTRYSNFKHHGACAKCYWRKNCEDYKNYLAERAEDGN